MICMSCIHSAWLSAYLCTALWMLRLIRKSLADIEQLHISGEACSLVRGARAPRGLRPEVLSGEAAWWGGPLSPSMARALAPALPTSACERCPGLLPALPGAYRQQCLSVVELETCRPISTGSPALRTTTERIAKVVLNLKNPNWTFPVVRIASFLALQEFSAVSSSWRHVSLPVVPSRAPLPAGAEPGHGQAASSARWQPRCVAPHWRLVFPELGERTIRNQLCFSLGACCIFVCFCFVAYLIVVCP